MVLLPDGFSLPPWPYLVGLLAGAVAVGYGLYRRQPSVTANHVLGLAPWMVVGSCLHVLYVIDGLPAVVEPFAGTAAVYLTVGIVAGGIWLAALSTRPAEQVPMVLTLTGGLALLPVVAGALAVGANRGTLTLFWPAVGAIATLPVTAIAWGGLRRLRPVEASTTGSVGLLALFGHILDAVSTTVGIDILGFGERTPLSRWIMEFAAELPTAELLGTGWLFLLVKVGLVGGVIVLFADFIEETPAEGYLLLGFIAAVGLGPGAHNLLLFAVTGGL